MKTRNIFNISIALVLFLSVTGFAQEKNYQSFVIHEDHVKPSAIAEYESICKEMIDASKKHGVTKAKWMTLASSEFVYSYITPVDKMADLDDNTFSELAEGMGNEAFGNMFKRMDKYYTDHRDYIITMDKELSYQPGGINQMPEGKMYRNNVKYYVSPENYAKANEIAKKYKKLFTEKGSKMYYRVYRSGFGADGTFFLVAVAAENPAAYEQMQMENSKLLGAEGAALNKELLSIIDKMETMQGWMRPDLSYSGN